MRLHMGTYRFGPDNGTLEVRTRRTGAAARAGHNLRFKVTAWEATLSIGEDAANTAVALDADGGSLRVLEGTGGVHALADDDKAEIERTVDDEVLKRERIRFQSSRVEARDGAALYVQGDLTLHGTTAPLQFEVDVADGDSVHAVAVVRQTVWGMKPYSTLFGALKVVDEVEVRIAASLPAPQTSAPEPQSR
jgi:YceI-like domain